MHISLCGLREMNALQILSVMISSKPLVVLSLHLDSILAMVLWYSVNSLKLDTTTLNGFGTCFHFQHEDALAEAKTALKSHSVLRPHPCPSFKSGQTITTSLYKSPLNHQAAPAKNAVLGYSAYPVQILGLLGQYRDHHR